MNSMLWESPTPAFTGTREYFDDVIKDREDWWNQTFFREEDHPPMAPGLTEHKENLHCMLQDVKNNPTKSSLVAENRSSLLSELFLPTSVLNNSPPPLLHNQTIVPKPLNGDCKNEAPLLLPIDDDMPILQPLEFQECSKLSKKSPNLAALEMPTLVPITLDSNCSSSLKDKVKKSRKSRRSSSLSSNSAPPSPRKQKKKFKKKCNPQVDLIDGVKILSFVSESDLQKYATKRDHTSLEGKVEESQGKENIIVPTKTKDITQIKGWRTKYFGQLPSPETTNLMREESSISKRPKLQASEKMPDGPDGLNPDESSSSREGNAKLSSVFSSRSLDDYLETQSKLEINFLTYFNPNIKPFKEDSPIFDMGPFCKDTLESPFCSTNSQLVQNEPPPVHSSMDAKESGNDFEVEVKKTENIFKKENMAPPKKKDESTIVDNTPSTSNNLRVVMKLRKDPNGSDEDYKITDFNLGGDKSRTKDLVQKIGTKDPVRKIGTKDSVRKIGTKDPVQKIGTKDPVQKIGTKDPVQKIGTKDPVRKIGTKDPVQKIGTKDAVQKIGIQDPLQKIGTKDPVQKIGTKDPVPKMGTKDLDDPVPDHGWVYQGMENPGNLIQRTHWTNSSHDKKQLKIFLNEQNLLAEALECKAKLITKKPSLEFPMITEQKAKHAVSALDIPRKKLQAKKRKHGSSTATARSSSLQSTLESSATTSQQKSDSTVTQGVASSVRCQQLGDLSPALFHLNGDSLIVVGGSSPPPQQQQQEESGGGQPPAAPVTEVSPASDPVPIIVSSCSVASTDVELMPASETIQNAPAAEEEDEVECLGTFPIKRTFRGGEVPLIVINSSDSETESGEEKQQKDKDSSLLQLCRDNLGPVLPEVSTITSIAGILQKAEQRILELQRDDKYFTEEIVRLTSDRARLYSQYQKSLEGLSSEQKKNEQIVMFKKLFDLNHNKLTAPGTSKEAKLQNVETAVTQPANGREPAAMTPTIGRTLSMAATTVPLRIMQQSVRPMQQSGQPVQPYMMFKIGEKRVGSLTCLRAPSSTAAVATPKHIVASPQNVDAARLQARRLFGTCKVTKCRLQSGKVVFVYSPCRAAAPGPPLPQQLPVSSEPPSSSLEQSHQENLPPLPSSLEEDTSVWLTGDGEPCIVTRLNSDEEGGDT